MGWTKGFAMSRTVKGKKYIGYEYWSRRPYSGIGYGSWIKRMTNRIERRRMRLIERQVAGAKLEASND